MLHKKNAISKYSIILPVKNGGEYLHECVDSILNQTIQDFNLVVLDNNSTDDSVKWLESMNDRRITIHKSNSSLSIQENWSRIVSIDKNEFITIIGHDDILLPGYLESMNSLIQEFPDASLYQCHYSFIDSDGVLIEPCLPMDKIQFAHEFIAMHFMKTMNSMGSGYMMRSKDYDRVGGIPDYPNLIFADYQLWIELTAISYKVTLSNELFKYRIHNSVSRMTGGEAYQQAFEKYIFFLQEKAKQDVQVKQVIERYGKKFLMDYCESLSHRLLKTPVSERKLRVSDFIHKCSVLATTFIPGQSFEPLSVKRIKLAKQLDSNSIGRSAFQLFKKLSS